MSDRFIITKPEVKPKVLFADAGKRLLCLLIYALILLPIVTLLFSEPWQDARWLITLYATWVAEIAFIVFFIRWQAMRRGGMLLTIIVLLVVMVGVNLTASSALVKTERVVVEGEAIAMRAAAGELSDAEIRTYGGRIKTMDVIEAQRTAQAQQYRWILAGVTFLVLVFMFGLSSVPPEQFVKTPLFILGMLVLSFEYAAMPDSRALTGLCFAGFLFGVLLLMLIVAKRNRLVAILGMVLVAGIAVFVTLFSSEFLLVLGWLRDYVLAPVIMALAYVFGLILNLINFDWDSEGPRLIETPTPEPGEATPIPLTTSEPGTVTSVGNTGAAVLVAIVMIAAVVILYILIKRHQANRRPKLPPRELRAKLTAEEIAQFLREESQLQEAQLGRNEMRIRRIMRGTLRRMYRMLYPITQADTVNQAHATLNRKLEKYFEYQLFPLYDRVRYGNGTVTQQELEAAEKDYKDIKQNVNGYQL